MDVDEIRTAFRRFAGAERYPKFVRAVSQRCPEKGRLFFWQEQLWSKFVSTLPEANNLKGEILRIFCVCDIHHCDLEAVPPVDEVAAVFRRTPDYDHAFETLFPLAKSLIFECPQCRRERQKWMSEHEELCRILRQPISYEAYCNAVIDDIHDDMAREEMRARMKPVNERMTAAIAAQMLPGDELWEWDTGMSALQGASGVAIVRNGQIVKKWCLTRA